MASFLNTLNPTPYGIFDSDLEFQTEADGFVLFVKRKLGDDVLSVELTKKMIWMCLEESLFEYGKIVNEYQAKSQLTNFLGISTGSLEGQEQKYSRETLEFFLRKAEPYAMQAGLGGSYNAASGSITLVKGQQDYNIYETLNDAAGNPLVDSSLNKTGGKMKIMEVFHFNPHAAWRFFNQSSATNYLANEFSFESFTPETMFYVLPVFEDILRGGMLDMSNRVRRSNYTYKIVGQNIRIFPVPSSYDPQKLWMRVMFEPDPTDPDINDPSIYGVSNLSNIPFGNIQFSKINSIGRQWVRQYAMALAMELLGWIRSKFASVPIPGGDLSLNGQDLLTRGREDQEKLQTSLREMLESTTYEKLVETEAAAVDSLQKILRSIPTPNGRAIFIG